MSALHQAQASQMSLRMSAAVAALKFLQIARHIEVESRTLKPNNAAGNTALAAIVDMANQA